jgi:F-type H+-transporting ATPase subunit gamma
MSTLRALRKRLQSIKSIKQLTRAMEMVAASRLHVAQVKAKKSQPFIHKINTIISLLSSLSRDFTHPLFEQKKVKKTGVLVISADMGLCGSYNKDVISATNQFLKNYDPAQIELILIGHKAVNYYKHRQWPIFFQMLDWGEKMTFPKVKNLTNQLVNWFLSGELDEIWFIYTHYISMMSRKVTTKKFLNIEKPSEKSTSLDYIIEPSLPEVYGEILSRYCLTTVQTALNESYASELAARVFAMKAASKNADEMVDKLTLLRNKVRQAGITKEMIEITSGNRE